MLDLRRVRVFQEVADRRSFSDAADALNYTQPSVSHHIASLEAELGQRLVNRGIRPLTLTQAGEVLHRAASSALAEFERAELELRALAEGAAGRLSVGSVVTGMRSVVPAAAREFTRRFPRVELALAEVQPPEVLARLRSGRLDVGIVVSPHDTAVRAAASTFASHLLAEQSLMLALPSSHRLASRRHLRLGALKGERWLLPSPQRFPEFRAEADALLAAAGVSSPRVLECSDDVAGARLVAAGVGVALVPVLGALTVPGVKLVAMRPALTRRLYAVTIAGRDSEPVAAFLGELHRSAARLASS